MDRYSWLRNRVKQVTMDEADADEVAAEIIEAYNNDEISGTDYDSLMALIDDWR